MNKKYFKAVMFLICSSFCFSFMAVFVRLSGDLPFIQKTFFRNSIAVIIAGFTIVYDIKKTGLQAVAIPKGSFSTLIIRSIAGTIGIFGNFYAIDHLILSDASILNKMSPFFAVLFSFLLLREKIRLIPFLTIFIAFCGSILVVKPSFQFTAMIPSLAGLLSGIGAGFAYACVRKLSIQKCNGHLVILFFCGFSLLCSVPFLIYHFEPMTMRQVICLLCAGLAAAGGQFTITAAYYSAPAASISIFDYSQIIFAAGFGFFLFNQTPDIYSFIGYCIIVSMAILAFMYNKKDK